MKPWLRLHVGGQLWSVYLIERGKYLGASDSGACCPNQCSIYVRKSLSDSSRDDTLLHELLHSVLFVSGGSRELYELCGDAAPAVEERIVGAMTPILHKILLDLGFQFPRAS